MNLRLPSVYVAYVDYNQIKKYPIYWLLFEFVMALSQSKAVVCKHFLNVPSAFQFCTAKAHSIPSYLLCATSFSETSSSAAFDGPSSQRSAKLLWMDTSETGYSLPVQRDITTKRNESECNFYFRINRSMTKMTKKSSK